MTEPRVTTPYRSSSSSAVARAWMVGSSSGAGSADQRPGGQRRSGRGAGDRTVASAGQPGRSQQPGAVGAPQPAQPGCAGPRCPGHLPVGGVAAGDQGADRSERVAGDPAGPGQVPERGDHVLVAQHRVHAAGDVRQLAEEVAAAVVPQMVQQPLLGVAGLELDGRVQRQFGRIGQMQAHPAVVARQRAGAGPEDLPGSHEFVQHGRLVVGHPARQDQRFPRRRRNGHAGELVDGGDDAVQPAQRRLAAAGPGCGRSARPAGTGRRRRRPPAPPRPGARPGNGGGACAGPRRRTIR